MHVISLSGGRIVVKDVHEGGLLQLLQLLNSYEVIRVNDPASEPELNNVGKQNLNLMRNIRAVGDCVIYNFTLNLNNNWVSAYKG